MHTAAHRRRSSWRRVLQCVALLGAGWIADPAATLADAAVNDVDPRQVYSAASPAWLRAVGKLQVPGSRYAQGRRSHHREDCSATLVTTGTAGRANTIVTAWHCLEFYSDLSRPITFTLLPGSERSIAREAYRVADGGGMHADWAILRLLRPVTTEEVPAIRVHPQRADASRPITMAGYSRDDGLGERGELLTFDAACRITSQGRELSNSDCTAYKGASGGAVIQLSAAGEPWLSGVISQGDGAGLSIYVPADRFRGPVNLSQP